MTPVEADRRFRLGFYAIAFTCGGGCWAIVGSIWGAVGLWVTLAICVLVMAVGARAVKAGGE